MRFKDKIAVVTGAATGIGGATADAFSAEGASVVLSDVNEADLQGRTRKLNAAGGNCIAVVADASDPADAQRMAREAVSAFGGIDCLVASAGIQTYGSVVTTDEATWDRTLAINAKGVYLAARHCIPEMAKRGRRRGGDCGFGAGFVQPAQCRGLRGFERRRHRHDAHDGDRPRRRQYPRQQHLPRLDQYAHAALRRRADAAGRSRRRHQRLGRLARPRARGFDRKRWRRWRFSCAATLRLSSPARRSWPTAA